MKKTLFDALMDFYTAVYTVTEFPEYQKVKPDPQKITQEYAQNISLEISESIKNGTLNDYLKDPINKSKGRKKQN